MSSNESGLPLGIAAIAVRKSALLSGIPPHSGGGTIRLIAPGWVIWANGPDRYEAGIPTIINVVAFTKALQLMMKYGPDIFKIHKNQKLNVAEMIRQDELDTFSGQDLLDHLSRSVIGISIPVPTTGGLKPFINLDNSASTPSFRSSWQVARKAWELDESKFGIVVNEVMSICSEFLDAPFSAYDIIFTSNITEAVNIAAENLFRSTTNNNDTVIISSLLEHSSNDLLWRFLSKSQLIRLCIDSEGFLDLDQMERLLADYNIKLLFGKKRIRLVTISGASNVLGTYNDLGRISEIAHKYWALLLVDAAQLVAHREVSIQESDIDLLAFSAHKMYAPFGSGALVFKREIISFNRSGSEKIKSPGEMNTSGIAAMGKSIVLLQRAGMDLISEKEQALVAKALTGLSTIPGIIIYGSTDINSSRFSAKGSVIAFSVKNSWPNKLAPKLAERGAIGVRFGCHCAHILVKHLVGVTPSLEKFQRIMLTILPKVSLPGIVRISFGLGNTGDKIDRFLLTMKKILSEPDKKSKSIKGQLEEYINNATVRAFDPVPDN